HAFLRAGAVLPAELIEGYIRGVVAMFGASLSELACHRVTMDGRPFHLFELRWRGSPVPRVVARRSTDRMVLGLPVPTRSPQRAACAAAGASRDVPRRVLIGQWIADPLAHVGGGDRDRLRADLG